jgi:hypothetical protein
MSAIHTPLASPPFSNLLALGPALAVGMHLAIASPAGAQTDEPQLPPYTLTDDELKLDCRALTGRMRVRIRQLRSTLADEATSGVSRALKQVTVPIFGGTTHGHDQRADNRRDRAMLEAYNFRLAEKRCPTYDLARDLAPGATAEPRPVRDKPVTDKN